MQADNHSGQGVTGELATLGDFDRCRLQEHTANPGLHGKRRAGNEVSRARGVGLVGQELYRIAVVDPGGRLSRGEILFVDCTIVSVPVSLFFAYIPETGIVVAAVQVYTQIVSISKATPSE